MRLLLPEVDFQFHKVQLEVSSLVVAQEKNQFQFHKVQLEAHPFELQLQTAKFQFHKVQLEVDNHLNHISHIECFNSIRYNQKSPYSSTIIISLSFNSIRYNQKLENKKYKPTKKKFQFHKVQLEERKAVQRLKLLTGFNSIRYNQKKQWILCF